MTKTQDQLFFAFYNKNDGVRITDLHQGIVWGTQTEETRLDERLINRFDYDGDYGTVLNRFLMQSAIDYPLTVHGSGGQTHTFIHIQDTPAWPAKRGERVRTKPADGDAPPLASMIAGLTGAAIEHVPNPRREADENGSGSLDWVWSLQPCTGLMDEVDEIARRYADRATRAQSRARPIRRKSQRARSRKHSRRAESAKGGR